MSKRGRPPHPDILTPREWEVLACIREELSNEEIGERLGISLDGVKYHVTEILSKLGLENRHDAARWQPEGRRPRWAALPLILRPRIHWFSPIIASALAVAVAAGIALLVWALVATGGNSRTGTNVPSGPPATSAELILDRPSPAFYDIDFASDDEGWMLAGGGLLHTMDGGDSWDEIARISGSAIDFVDSKNGWIVGGDGLILATANGGRTWSRQASGTKVHLSDVFAVSTSEAWAVGDGQGHSDNIAFPLPTVLLHTTDGGTNWTPIPTPAGAWFSQLTFVGEEGWVLGTSSVEGAFLHTSDGGLTWTAIYPGLPDWPTSMAFVADSQHGWVIAGCLSSKTDCPPNVFRTEDGGQTWVDSSPNGYRLMSALAFRDAKTGWVVASEDKEQCPCGTFVLQTADGGKTWERRAEVPTGANQFTWSLQDRGDRLYVLGSQLALVSEDGGRSLATMRQPAIALGNLDFVDASVGFTVLGGTLLRTKDGGLTWERIGPAPDPYGGRVDFIDPEHGYAISGDGGIGDTGTVWRTEDGGRTWEQVSRPSESGGDELTFIDQEHGWLFSQDAIYVTHDGGRSWYASRPEPHGIEFKDMEAIDGRTAWAVVVTGGESDAKRLLRTIDGGRSWEVLRNPYDAGIFAALDRDHIWYSGFSYASGPHETLSFTSDGGATWSSIEMNNYRIQDIAFTDAKHGWISATVCETESGCTGGALLRTTDGGYTWTEAPLEQPLWGDLVFVDESAGWLQPLEYGFQETLTTVHGRTLLYRIR